MTRVGFFGGTFDPIHFGHLNLAIELREHWSIERVLFCPTLINPLKERRSLVSCSDRLKMVELAIGEVEGFSLLDWECRNQTVSYTVDTLQRLKKAEPNAELFLFIGEDTARSLHQWKAPERVIEIASPLVASRVNGHAEPLKGSPSLIEALEAGWTKTRVMEISATEIRERVARGDSVSHLVPRKVLDHIIENQLYLLAT